MAMDDLDLLRLRVKSSLGLGLRPFSRSTELSCGVDSLSMNAVDTVWFELHEPVPVTPGRARISER
jgi:hypothetical protein